MEVTEDELQSLYTWVDEIPLSRPKRNIARDFSDGVLMAEILHHYYPRLVDLHNYSSAHAMQPKLYNWDTLNTKVLRRLGFQLQRSDCEAIASAVPGSIERALKLVKFKIAAYTGDPDALIASPAPRQLQGTAGRSQSGQLQQYQQYQQQQQQQRPGELTSPIASTAGLSAKLSAASLQAHSAVSASALAEKEAVITDLREANEILETKVRKLEQLVKLKDAKIGTLMARLQANGLA